MRKLEKNDAGCALRVSTNKVIKKYDLVMKKEQVEGMWERLAAAISNAAVSSRFR
ncbi:MAG: hypothetical protein GY850_34575 [bacterium]|nr:hypothetical protein [bacterium]